MLYNSIEIEAVKLSVMRMNEIGLSQKDVLVDSIKYLKDNYVRCGEKRYLYKAIWHIYTYIDLGFCYNEQKKMFSEILEKLEINESVLRQQMNCKIIILNKTNVRDLLGRWNPVLHSMKVEEVVNDIIFHVRNRICGEYIYHCGKIIEENTDKMLWEHTFQLIINTSEAYIHDINNNKYYLLREKTNDKNSNCR